MRDTLHKAYNKIGFDLSNTSSPIGQEFRFYENCADEPIKKNIEFFLMDFAVAMLSIQKYDESAFNYYHKRIKNNSNLSFWGEYFEMILHYKHIDKAKRSGFKIRRGIIKHNEPDLVFFNDSAFFQAEITTLKFDENSNKKNPENKIIDRILEKNSKPYADDKCVLFINVSNLLFNEKLGISHFNNSFRNLLENLKSVVKFNRILLINTFFSESIHKLNYKYIADEYKYKSGNIAIDRFFSNKDSINSDIDETKRFFFKQY